MRRGLSAREISGCMSRLIKGVAAIVVPDAILPSLSLES